VGARRESVNARTFAVLILAAGMGSALAADYPPAARKHHALPQPGSGLDDASTASAADRQEFDGKAMSVDVLFEGSVQLYYRQICIFDADLRDPFNDWSDAHTRQGFSWRPGSVSFGTISDSIDYSLTLEIVPEPVQVSGALCAIAVPFTVPASGRVEVGGVMGGHALQLPPGHYRLFFHDFGEACAIRLVLVPSTADALPEIIKEYGDVRRPTSYVMHAIPA
jgi:hypothetical protein